MVTVTLWLVAASTRPGGWCLDFFAGSGTLGAVCRTLGRHFVLIDDNPQAIEVMAASSQLPDGKENARAFLEKRKPQWQRRS